MRSSMLCQLFQSTLKHYHTLLFLLVVVMIFFENFAKRRQHALKTFWQHFTLPMIFSAHSHIDVHRFQLAAVVSMVALEIVNAFDENSVASGKHFQHGPSLELIIQLGLDLMLALHYLTILNIF
jgi:hypothetical protein